MRTVPTRPRTIQNMPVTNDARRSNTSAKPSLVLGKNPIRLELAGGVVGVPDVAITAAG